MKELRKTKVWVVAEGGQEAAKSGVLPSTRRDAE